MIFVTVGNATQRFRRLLNEIDRLAGSEIFNGEVVIVQHGNDNELQLENCTQRNFLNPNEYKQLIREANVIVCHGGAGSLHHVFQEGKIPVVMPRRIVYSEALDDQYALVQTLASQGRIIPAYEPTDLHTAIIKAKHQAGDLYAQPVMMASLVAHAIEELISAR